MQAAQGSATESKWHPRLHPTPCDLRTRRAATQPWPPASAHPCWPRWRPPGPACICDPLLQLGKPAVPGWPLPTAPLPSPWPLAAGALHVRPQQMAARGIHPRRRAVVFKRLLQGPRGQLARRWRAAGMLFSARQRAEPHGGGHQRRKLSCKPFGLWGPLLAPPARSPTRPHLSSPSHTPPWPCCGP